MIALCVVMGIVVCIGKGNSCMHRNGQVMYTPKHDIHRMDQSGDWADALKMFMGDKGVL